jgi:anti-sigma regulatory factor (Ser/Thr protein kinase)
MVAMPSRHVMLDLAPTVGAARIARRELERNFSQHLPRLTLDDVKLIVSELVNNSVVHGSGPVHLDAKIGGRQVRLEVSDDDGSDAEPAVIHRPVGRGGLGLRIVDKLAKTWGTQQTHKTLVWAEVQIGATRV